MSPPVFDPDRPNAPERVTHAHAAQPAHRNGGRVNLHHARRRAFVALGELEAAAQDALGTLGEEGRALKASKHALADEIDDHRAAVRQLMVAIEHVRATRSRAHHGIQRRREQ